MPIDPSGRNLMDLRFADDVVLFAQQKADISKMLQHLADCSKKYGLKINFDKTKVLTSNYLSNGDSEISVGGRAVAILDEMDSEKYLGMKLCLHSVHNTEFENRWQLAGQPSTDTRANYAASSIP